MKWIKASLLFVVVSLIAIIVFFSFYEKKYERYLMLYRDKVTGEEQIENRYVALPTEKDSLNVFVEEFLLGPADYHLASFFPHGTTYRSLFLQDDVLYLDLPRDSVVNMPKGVQFQDFYDLFLKSLKINFPELKDVYIFIEGVRAYENT